MSVTRIFLDASGSAPLTPRVTNALRAGFADGWADASRQHSQSRQSRALVDGAREAIADGLGIPSQFVGFTASPHHAFERLIGGMYAARRGHDRIATTAIERTAASNSAHYWASQRVDVVGVDAQGHLDLDAFATAMVPLGTAVAVVQHANQEIGTVQDLEAVHAITAAAQVPLIVDATASIGHIAPPSHWDALVAHPADWGGPPGVGVIALQPHTRWLPAWPDSDPWIPGGAVAPLALGAAVALEERLENLAADSARLRGYVDAIRDRASTWEGVHVVGDPEARLPHVVTLAFMYLDGEPLVDRLDREGIAVGSGSACGTDTFEPSHVLAALGALTHGNLRLSLHPGIQEQDVERFLDVLPVLMDAVRRDMKAHR